MSTDSDNEDRSDSERSTKTRRTSTRRLFGRSKRDHSPPQLTQGEINARTALPDGKRPTKTFLCVKGRDGYVIIRRSWLDVLTAHFYWPSRQRTAKSESTDQPQVHRMWPRYPVQKVAAECG